MKYSMENELGKLYTVLARHLSSMIPVDWNKLYYLGEIGKKKESWSSVFYFEESITGKMIKTHAIPDEYGVSQEIHNELINELNTILLDIYSCFERHGQPLWEQINLSLTSDGAFNIDFYYDVMTDDDGGQIEREVVWAYKTFGFRPKEGSFTEELLGSYLERNK